MWLVSFCHVANIPTVIRRNRGGVPLHTRRPFPRATRLRPGAHCYPYQPLNVLKTSQAVTNKDLGRASEASMAAVLAVLAASKDRQPCEAFGDQNGSRQRINTPDGAASGAEDARPVDGQTGGS